MTNPCGCSVKLCLPGETAGNGTAADKSCLLQLGPGDSFGDFALIGDARSLPPLSVHRFSLLPGGQNVVQSEFIWLPGIDPPSRCFLPCALVHRWSGAFGIDGDFVAVDDCRWLTGNG